MKLYMINLHKLLVKKQQRLNVTNLNLNS